MKRTCVALMLLSLSMNGFCGDDEARMRFQKTLDTLNIIEPSVQGKKINVECEGKNGKTISKSFDVDLENPFPGVRAIARWADRHCEGDVNVSASYI